MLDVFLAWRLPSEKLHLLPYCAQEHACPDFLHRPWFVKKFTLRMVHFQKFSVDFVLTVEYKLHIIADAK